MKLWSCFELIKRKVGQFIDPSFDIANCLLTFSPGIQVTLIFRNDGFPLKI